MLVSKSLKYILSLPQYTKVMKTQSTSCKFFKSAKFAAAALLFFVLIGKATFAQDKQTTLKITQSIQSGNASTLAVHFNVSIDLTLPDYEGTYSKKQAEQIVKIFFKNHPVKSYTVEHSGNSNDGSCYMIGSHKTTTNKIFRVYILIKNRNNTDLIQQLQFEEE